MSSVSLAVNHRLNFGSQSIFISQLRFNLEKNSSKLEKNDRTEGNEDHLSPAAAAARADVLNDPLSHSSHHQKLEI